jgi:mannose-6-phosphate isomerase
MSQRPEPLTLEPQLVSPIWGGRKLAGRLSLPDPHPERLGEVWLVYEANRILDGAMAGRTLGEATLALGQDLVGSWSFRRYGSRFPLLVKLLDTAATLSVQVHPDDAYAAAHEAGTGHLGKNEAWYILDADPGAEVVLGLKHPVDRDRFVDAARAGTLDGLLERHPVAPGEAILVPAGTIHTIGPGITLYEIQQASDLTYRVYDFGRTDPGTGRQRDLHLDKALDVATLGPAIGASARSNRSVEGERLVGCESFVLDRVQVRGPTPRTTDPASVEILTVVVGRSRLGWDGGSLELAFGGTAVVPAALGAYDLEPVGSGPATVLRASVPDAG